MPVSRIFAITTMKAVMAFEQGLQQDCESAPHPVGRSPPFVSSYSRCSEPRYLLASTALKPLPGIFERLLKAIQNGLDVLLG